MFSASALSHGVAALLAHHLQSVNSEATPRAVTSKLQFENQQDSERCLFLASALLKIVCVLRENGVPAIAFKGPTLALMAYGTSACDSSPILMSWFARLIFRGRKNFLSIMVSRLGPNLKLRRRPRCCYSIALRTSKIER